MSKTKRRLKAQKRLAVARSKGIVWEPTCPNCGEKGPHFVPPSFGDKGFFICEKKPTEGGEKK